MRDINSGAGIGGRISAELLRYAPVLLADKNEPFPLERIGVTVMREAGTSPSFRRSLPFENERLDYIIEFAYYWDFDIQHVYDLEHVWIYVGKDGTVLDCEASFHGKYMRGLLRDRSNIEGTRVKLYVQPGKHAFSPMVELFELLPNLESCAWQDAGNEGLLVTGPFQGAYETSPAINDMVRIYMKRFRFKPAMEFTPYTIPEDRYVTWETLRREVPERVADVLTLLEQTLKREGVH